MLEDETNYGKDDANQTEDDISEKIKDKYLITYEGTLKQFEDEHLASFAENQFSLKDYIELADKTIIMAEYHGNENDLEQRLSEISEKGFVIEREHIYRAMNSQQENKTGDAGI